MMWLETVREPSLDAALDLKPELARRYRAFMATLDSARVPPRTRELCRLRIATIHDCDPEWRRRDASIVLTDADLAALRRGDVTAFTPDERAALAVAERMPYQHHELEDAEVARLAATLGDAGTVALLTALAFYDVTCRLRLVLGTR